MGPCNCCHQLFIGILVIKESLSEILSLHSKVKTVADLGGQMGATAPLHDENSALAPPFWQGKRPFS